MKANHQQNCSASVEDTEMIHAESNSPQKRLEELEKGDARRKRKQKENNKRNVCIKKKTTSRLEYCRQYPAQSLAEIVDRCLNRYLDSIGAPNSRRKKFFQKESES